MPIGDKVVVDDRDRKGQEMDKEYKVQKKEKQLRSRKRGTSIRRIAVISVLAALSMMLMTTFLISVVRVDRNAMSPTLQQGDVVVTLKYTAIERGDTIAFYQGNQILFRRVIGTEGDWITIDEEGKVKRNTEILEEAYVSNQSLGGSDIEFPYRVQTSRYFVLADDREVMTDSRVALIGSIAQKQMIGETVFRIWPLNRIGRVS